MSSFRSSALKCACAALAAALAGCGPSDGSSELAAGEAAYARHDLVKAERLFARSTELGGTVGAYVRLAQVELDLGELPAAKEAVEIALESASSDPDVVLLAAQIAWHGKNYAVAAERFGRLAADAKLPVEIRSQAFAGLGVVRMTENARDLARICFLRAIRLDRKNAAAWYHLGLVYRDFGYFEAALEQFEIFVRLNEVADTRVQKVQRTVIPDLKETIARAASERPGVAKRDSAASAAALAQAEASVKKGAYKTARQHYEKAFAADPLSYPAALGLARMTLKTDDSKVGQQKALAAYLNACQLRPSAVSTFITTGDLAFRLGNYASAVEVYSRAVAANPADITAIDGLIRALGKVGGQAKTARAYQEYRDTIPVRRK